MATEPVDGILHTVTNDTPAVGSTYGAQSGALTSKFSVWMVIPQHHDRITILNAQVPKTYYLINSAAHSFQLIVQDSKSNYHTYEFDVNFGAGYGYGNYTSITFLTALNDALNWKRDGLLGSPPGTWTIGTYSRKYTLDLSVGGHGGETFGTALCGVTQLPLHLARYMGYPSPQSLSTIYQSSYGVGVTTLVSPYVVNFTLTNVIHVCCDIGQEDVPASKGNCIGRIYMGDIGFGAFVTLFNNNPYETSRRLQTRELNTTRGNGNVYRLVTFSLVDDDGDVIDINGGHVVMGIFTYTRASLYELTRRAVNSYAEVSQEQRQVNLAQLNAVKRLRPNPVAESTII